MNIDKLYDFVRDFYGYKIEMLFINETEKSIGGILYDSFFVMWYIDLCLSFPTHFLPKNSVIT